MRRSSFSSTDGLFWGVGVRLLLMALRQAFQHRFTAAEIFHMKGEEALPLVRELALANIATGSVGRRP
jgi:hypothetical protein